MSKGFWRLKWLHLKGLTIDRTERIKTNLRSVDGRIYGRPDERINPSDLGRMRRNCRKVFRIHKRMQSTIGHSLTTSESWRSLPWKQFQKTLFRLQKRVYKAVRVGDKRKARSLQKLILKSQAAKLLAIRQVTQLNAGKKTAGIDGKASLTFEERFALLGAVTQLLDDTGDGIFRAFGESGRFSREEVSPTENSGEKRRL